MNMTSKYHFDVQVSMAGFGVWMMTSAARAEDVSGAWRYRKVKLRRNGYEIVNLKFASSTPCFRGP
jgi:hypothetical protein